MIRNIFMALIVVAAIGCFVLEDITLGFGGGWGGGWGKGGWGGGGSKGGRNPGRNPGGNNPGKGRRNPGDVDPGEVLKGEKFNKEFDFDLADDKENSHHRSGVYTTMTLR
jgi:hypothetical protein